MARRENWDWHLSYNNKNKNHKPADGNLEAGHALFLTDVLQARELVHPQVEIQVQKPHATDLGGHLFLEVGSGRGVHLGDHVLDGLVLDGSNGEVLGTSHPQVRSYPLLLATRQRAEPLNYAALDPVHRHPPSMVLGEHGARRSRKHPKVQSVRLLRRCYSLRGSPCDF